MALAQVLGEVDKLLYFFASLETTVKTVVNLHSANLTQSSYTVAAPNATAFTRRVSPPPSPPINLLEATDG